MAAIGNPLLGRPARLGLLIALVTTIVLIAAGDRADPTAIEDAPTASAQEGPQTKYFPARLALAPGFGLKDVCYLRDVATGRVPAITMPCGLAPLSRRHVYLCDYRALFLIDLEQYTLERIDPPPQVKRWVPTGLAYDAGLRRLYVANNLGKDLLAFRIRADHHLEFVREYTHPRLVGPENVAVSPDGTLLAVGDYDGNAALLFHRDGRLLWTFPIAQCHGVAFLDGGRYVVATGLQDRKVFKLATASGRLVGQCGDMGWGKDGYLWPVGLCTTSTGQVVISDAHTGKISFLDADLHTARCTGGNGPDDTFFNMPYCVRPLGNTRLLVTDTFRSRLVVLDADGAIEKLYYLRRATDGDGSSPPGALLSGEFAATRPSSPGATRGVILASATKAGPEEADLQPGLSLYQAPAALPLGTGYDLYVSKARAVALSFPLLGGNFPTTWHEGYGRLVSSDGRGPEALMEGGNHLYTGSEYYFLFGVNSSSSGRAYTILWSPSCATVLCVRDGLAVPLTLKQDLWPGNGNLLDRGHAILAGDLVRAAEQRLGAFERLARREKVPPQEALRRSLFPNCPAADFPAALRQSFVSEAGKIFVRAYLNAPSAPARWQAAQAFREAIANSAVVRLPELFLWHSLVYAF